MSLAAIRSARPEALDDAARSWQRISERLDAQILAVKKDVIAPLADGAWSGRAADAATAVLDRHARELVTAREYADSMAAVMRDAATGVGDAQACLRAADELAASRHLTLGPDGSVSLAGPVVAVGPQAAGAAALTQALPPAAGEVSDLARRAAALADEVDARITARLREIGTFPGVSAGDEAAAAAILASAVTLAGAFDRSAIPGGAADPAEVSAWWRGLSADQQRRLIDEFPSRIGWLDGLPATARNAANTLSLDRERDRLQGQLQALDRAEPPKYTTGLGPHDAQRVVDNPAWQQWNQEVTGIEAKLARISAVETGMATAASIAGAGNVYLLGFDTGGDNGHAIVAVGNPDTANNTVTYVPGLGSTVSGAAGDIHRAATLWQRASLFAANGQKISSIYWLNYNAPQLGLDQGVSTFDVTSTHDAIAGASSLTRFQAGLGAAHQPNVSSHTVVLGHSYGSLVVGEAAARDGMRPGDIIFVGSPGVGVDHAAQLGIPPSHVWAGANPHDPVPRLVNPATWVTDPDAGWFGNNPATGAFGGQGFDASHDLGHSFSGLDFSAHSAYWDPRSSSLFNMAHIVDSQYGLVTRTH